MNRLFKLAFVAKLPSTIFLPLIGHTVVILIACLSISFPGRIIGGFIVIEEVVDATEQQFPGIAREWFHVHNIASKMPASCSFEWHNPSWAYI